MTDDIDLLAFGPSDWGERQLARLIDRECQRVRKQASTAVVDTCRTTAVEPLSMIDIQNPANWDKPLFPIAIAADAARVAPNTMRVWFDRKRVTLTEYDTASSPEQPTRLLTLRSVLALAVAADLSRSAGGLDVSTAMAVAKHWAYVQHNGTVDGQPVEALPAGLFAGDRVLTVLIHHGGEPCQVRPLQIDATTGELRGLNLLDVFPAAHPVRARSSMVALNWIDRHVRAVCEAYLQAKEG